MTADRVLRTITTDRLVLKDFNKDNLDDLFEIYGDDETMKFNTMTAFSNVEELISKLDFNRGRINLIDKLGIFLNEKLIGTCGFSWFNAGKDCIVSYDLNKNFWNKGYTTEVVRALTRFGFDDLKLRRIIAIVFSGNEASERVLEKCGYVKESLLTNSVLIKGEYRDEYLFSNTNYTPAQH